MPCKKRKRYMSQLKKLLTNLDLKAMSGDAQLLIALKGHACLVDVTFITIADKEHHVQFWLESNWGIEDFNKLIFEKTSAYMPFVNKTRINKISTLIEK